VLKAEKAGLLVETEWALPFNQQLKIKHAKKETIGLGAWAEIWKKTVRKMDFFLPEKTWMYWKMRNAGLKKMFLEMFSLGDTSNKNRCLFNSLGTTAE